MSVLPNLIFCCVNIHCQMKYALNLWNSVFLVSFNLHNLHYMCKKWSCLCMIQDTSKCQGNKTNQRIVIFILFLMILFAHDATKNVHGLKP